jgi:uncharacterized protein YndB with AHSA1/START domain
MPQTEWSTRMSNDIVDLVGLVRREVRDGPAMKVVVASRAYDTDIDDLWDAITNAERLPRWFAPVTGEFKLGGRYQIQGNAGGTVTRCEAPKHLSLTWEFGGGVSWLEVDLSKNGDGTLLELRHTAYPEAHWDQFGAGAVGIGWDLTLFGLGQHIRNPELAKPVEADPAWTASDEAKRFMRAAGDRWGEAEIASGEDRETALRRSETTKKFYCGET